MWPSRLIDAVITYLPADLFVWYPHARRSAHASHTYASLVPPVGLSLGRAIGTLVRDSHPF